MIGIVIATHANLAQGLVNAAEMILGPLPGVEVLSIGAEDGPDDIHARFASALARLDVDGEGVLVLTDMFGGTPTNIGCTFMGCAQVEVLAGVSLPMLLKACSARSGSSLNDLAAEVKEYALKSILLVSQLLKEQGPLR
ncbi:MAG: PTS sugar transporter subunit IIA [Desulfuromonadaceae bacterium]|nr:PTS sugar transporter subunit IIA [Desulfuromonadaceae bacterium]